MPSRLLVMFMAACLLAPACAPQVAADEDLPPVDLPTQTGQPNIVVFYIDDTAPHDGRLWSDSAITPAIYEHFVAHGTRFDNAIVETPLCCPARSGLLTGLHTHNHGVKVTDARLFDPSEHIGHALQRAGYDTLLIGKYLNSSYLLTPEQWQEHAAGWTEMDVFNNNEKAVAEQFYENYSLFTKQGVIPTIPGQHSTQMIGERTVMRMAQVAPERPLFAEVSIFNTHFPNIPMPGFDFSVCDAMPPWNPPNYNEADVSDKPARIRNLALLPDPDGWPMDGYCREMLGVDWVVAQVTAELEREGRLDNTLLIFTADNGMTWGAHRIGQQKMWPSSTPVPLYMSWPARWGDEPRVISEYTSNIDLAPTLCDIAGCALGPYDTGQLRPDGISLLPVLDGEVTSLGRDALLETNYQSRVWTAIRTTPASALGEWHYVEWSGGARELYNAVLDPWELDNLAGNPAYAVVQSALAQRLSELLLEGVPTRISAGQPDAAIAASAGGPFKGVAKYNSKPVKRQTQRITGIRQGGVYDFYVRLESDSALTDSLSISALTAAATGTTVTYLVDGLDVTLPITTTGYTMEVGAGSWTTLVVRVSVVASVGSSTIARAVVTARSALEPSRLDVVRAVARR